LEQVTNRLLTASSRPGNLEWEWNQVWFPKPEPEFFSKITLQLDLGFHSFWNWNYSKFFLKNWNLRFFIKVKNHPTLAFASLDEDEKEMRSKS
jgi:hypothetical protein